MAITEIPSTLLGSSSQLLLEAKSMEAPAFLAAIIFSAMPPIAPTAPSAAMVPDPEIFLPCKRSSGVRSSMRPSENISPPLGPPVSGRSTFIEESLRCDVSIVG